MSQSGKSILIVDDAYGIQQRVRTMLEGYEGTMVASAGSYAEALVILQALPVSVVILDINLPDINGIELLKYIKESYPSIPVIMMSNQSGEFYRARCRMLGASYFIDKSTDFELLLPIIHQLL